MSAGELDRLEVVRRAHGAPLRTGRVGLRLLRGHAGLSRPPRPAGGLLQRSTASPGWLAATRPAARTSQFGRALAELNIDIICANTPQAKGRVERTNKTLQDRLVRELRLRGISRISEGNAFLAEFMDDYTRRFGRAPRDPHDAHCPLRGDEDLDRIFSRQEDRRMSGSLTVHFKRRAYLVTPTPETLPLGGKTLLSDRAGGTKRSGGLPLAT